MMKKQPPIKLLSVNISILIATGLLSACQSTGNINTERMVKPFDNKLVVSQQAKEELQEAIENQLKSSFTYQTQVEISNSKKLATLLNASPEQLSNVDNKREYCDATHDKAYVTILKQAEEAGEDLFNNKYTQQLESIKQNYLACEQEYQNWNQQHYLEGDDTKYMPDYDSENTSKDLKGAQLLNAYLLKPMDISVTGSYQPLAGKITVLPAFSYQQRNVLAKINQPMYVDLKQGMIYFWAANIAGTNARYLDDKLGAKWHNKWLKFELNDGSLPKNIGKDLISAYLKALEVSYQQEPKEGFNYISRSSLFNELDELTNQQKNMIERSNKIISRIHNSEVTSENSYIFEKTFYDAIIKKHPELMIDNQANLSLADMTFDSLTILKLLLKSIHASVTDYENPSAIQVLNEVEGADAIGYEGYYGLNWRNQIAWSHHRVNLSNNNTDKDPMTMSAITQFDYGTLGKSLFSNLPQDAQIPTESNSIDLRVYYKELLEHYEQGGGTAIGKLGFGYYRMMQGFKTQDTEAIEANVELAEPDDVNTIDGDTDLVTDPDILFEEQNSDVEVIEESE